MYKYNDKEFRGISFNYKEDSDSSQLYYYSSEWSPVVSENKLIPSNSTIVVQNVFINGVLQPSLENKSIMDVIDFALKNNILISDDFLSSMDNLMILVLSPKYQFGITSGNKAVKYIGIYSNTEEELLGIGRDSDIKMSADSSIMLYSFEKFMSTLITGGCNVADILGCDKNNYVFVSEEGKKLIESSDKFLCHRLLRSYEGYMNNLRKSISEEKDLRRLHSFMDELIRLHIVATCVANGVTDFHLAYKDELQKLSELFIDGTGYIEDGKPSEKYYSSLEEYTSRYLDASINTLIPNKIDYTYVNKLVVDLNKSLLKLESK